MRLSLMIVTMTLVLMIDVRTTPSPKDYEYQDSGYDKKDNCYHIGYPKKYTMSVGYGLQSTKIRSQIHNALKDYPAVNESLKNSECQKAYHYSYGQEETCPTDRKLVTKVYIGKEWCNVAKPNYQCVTAASCQTPREPCAGYQIYPMTSSCMYAGFRYFRVWVYCGDCDFKLIKLKLPQSCSCMKFQMCEEDGNGDRNGNRKEKGDGNSDDNADGNGGEIGDGIGDVNDNSNTDGNADGNGNEIGNGTGDVN